MRLLLFSILCVTLSSCGFGYLTEIDNQDKTAPRAEDCGACHVEQYAEWQQTRHARAFISLEFKQQSDHSKDEGCLFCHVPGDVHDPEREPRLYNREEGVTCVSCHLHDKAMQGPHVSGALISPHAIAQNNQMNSKIDSAELCGICHHETYEQWLDHQDITNTPAPTCHSCHGAPVKRTHTQGPSLFSDLLVAFEPEHEVRSHHLMLPGQNDATAAPKLELVESSPDQVTFTLINSLPHELPTGSFGEKHLMVIVNRLEGDTIVATNSMSIPEIIRLTQSVTMGISLPSGRQNQHLQINLLRRHRSTNEITLIRSYHFQEDTHAHTP
ncbi:MAG: multiheme c-type cytochrome [Spirochaetales bacterium]|jgi:hypothetical protein|nr:multiheme c-type cytochrome [Spirochaetales bacterium]